MIQLIGIAMFSLINNIHSLSVSLARLGSGLSVRAYCRKNPPRPAQTLELYQYEGCPFCRKVREAMSSMDLAYIARTSARGAGTNREFVGAHTGKMQFPYLYDPNNDIQLFESEDII